MYHYYYDGDFDGLLSVVFESYKHRKELGRISAEPEQLAFDTSEIYVATDVEKARRVEKYLREKFSYQFFADLQACFLSCEPHKDEIIVRMIFRAMECGEGILESVDEYALQMNKLVRNVLRERHRYLGLLRFREMHDGTLFSTIEPKNNVLPILLSHFKNRLVRERFAIYDKKRNMLAYYDGQRIDLFFTEKVEIKWSDAELEYAFLWNVFHKSISIRERQNKKLQQSNLPKYYWRHLVEDMTDGELG